MQRIGKICSLGIPVKRSSDGQRIFHYGVFGLQQQLKESVDALAGQFVGGTQYPFGLQQHGARNQDAMGLEQVFGDIGLLRVVVDNEAHQHIGIKCDHRLFFSAAAQSTL